MILLVLLTPSPTPLSLYEKFEAPPSPLFLYFDTPPARRVLKTILLLQQFSQVSSCLSVFSISAAATLSVRSLLPKFSLYACSLQPCSPFLAYTFSLHPFSPLARFYWDRQLWWGMPVFPKTFFHFH